MVSPFLSLIGIASALTKGAASSREAMAADSVGKKRIS